MVRGVIIYLTQANHSSYKGRNSQLQLQQSIRLLYEHYNNAHRDDVVVFHQGDVKPAQQQAVLSLCVPGTARFHVLPPHHFQQPPDVGPERWQYARKFSVGYRHMIRFFTMGLWETVYELGYDYVLRLDEDSYIWSPIRYNIFHFMHDRGLEYVYRLATWERGQLNRGMDGFHRLVREYAHGHGLKLGWLLGPCDLRGSCAQNQTACFSVNRCGNLYAPYNNFFATRVGFWKRPDVTAFLRYVNHSHTIYVERYGDALWHSATLAMFMAPERIAMVHDFAYEHATFVTAQSQSPPPKLRSACRLASGQVSMDKKACESAVDTPPGCLSFGGIGLSTLDNSSSQLAALERMANLSLALLRCQESDTLFRSTCLIRPSLDRHPSGLYASRVTDEQISCDREPRPFFCENDRALNGSFDTFDREIDHFENTRKRRLLAANTSKAVGRIIRVQDKILERIFESRQLRAVCANWCYALDKPSPRLFACHRRAERAFLQVARGKHRLQFGDGASGPAHLGARVAKPRTRTALEQHEDLIRWQFSDTVPAPAHVVTAEALRSPLLSTNTLPSRTKTLAKHRAAP